MEPARTSVFRASTVVNKLVRNDFMKIGYARVSSQGQNLDRQIGALRAQRVDKLFSEKASGGDVRNRPQLEKAIDLLGTGDTLVVAEWDRATRSMMDGIAIIERIHARGALIKVLDKPHLDLTTPLGRGFIAFLSAMAEDERQRITKRAHEGRAAARRRGVQMGRKPKLDDHQRKEAIARLKAGEARAGGRRSSAVAHEKAFVLVGGRTKAQVQIGWTWSSVGRSTEPLLSEPEVLCGVEPRTIRPARVADANGPAQRVVLARWFARLPPQGKKRRLACHVHHAPKGSASSRASVRSCCFRAEPDRRLRHHAGMVTTSRPSSSRSEHRTRPESTSKSDSSQRGIAQG